MPSLLRRQDPHTRQRLLPPSLTETKAPYLSPRGVLQVSAGTNLCVRLYASLHYVFMFVCAFASLVRWTVMFEVSVVCTD